MRHAPPSPPPPRARAEQHRAVPILPCLPLAVSLIVRLVTGKGRGRLVQAHCRMQKQPDPRPPASALSAGVQGKQESGTALQCVQARRTSSREAGGSGAAPQLLGQCRAKMMWAGGCPHAALRGSPTKPCMLSGRPGGQGIKGHSARCNEAGVTSFAHGVVKGGACSACAGECQLEESSQAGQRTPVLGSAGREAAPAQPEPTRRLAAALAVTAGCEGQVAPPQVPRRCRQPPPLSAP